MFMGNSSYWNSKYSKRNAELMEPEGILVNDLPQLPKNGTALDLACGDGRNAVLLSKQGYKVTAMDFSDIAVERLRKFTLQLKLNILVYQCDLSEIHCLDKLGNFDLIILNHYRLDSRLYSTLSMHLKENGYLWINGFCKLTADNPQVTVNDLISEDDFKELEKLICVDYKNYKIGNSSFCRYIWKK